MYQDAKNALEDLRQKFKLDQIWPPITHKIIFILHMSTDNYYAATIRSYISGLNFSNKMHEHIDYTQSFVVKKLLAGVSKTNKINDIRKPITLEGHRFSRSSAYQWVRIVPLF